MTLLIKSDSKDLEWKSPKGTRENQFKLCFKSEIAFWCTSDQNISKTFQYFNVSIKSGLKVTFSAWNSF